MRVSLVTFGIGENFVPLASALTAHADVQLVLPDSEAGSHLGELAPALEVTTFRKPRYRQPVRQVAMCGRIARAIEQFAPDLVQVQAGHLWFSGALPFLRRYPVVLDVHDPRPHKGDKESSKTPQFVTRLAYRRAQHLLTHAQSVRRDLVEVWGADPAMVDVVPLSLGAAIESPPPQPNAPTVLFFGRIWPYKGLDVLLRAVPAVVAARPDVTFVVAGRGDRVARYVGSAGAPARVLVENAHISAPRREALFAAAAVVVLPYLEATSTGIVPFAYRHGVPVVASDVGGLPEVVRHGETGLLVPPGDPEALAGALLRLLDDPVARRRMGRAATTAFAELFDPTVNAARTAAVYSKVLRRAGVDGSTTGWVAAAPPGPTG